MQAHFFEHFAGDGDLGGLSRFDEPGQRREHLGRPDRLPAEDATIRAVVHEHDHGWVGAREVFAAVLAAAAYVPAEIGLRLGPAARAAQVVRVPVGECDGVREQPGVTIVEMRTDVTQSERSGADARLERGDGRAVRRAIRIDPEEELGLDVIGINEDQPWVVAVFVDEHPTVIDNDNTQRAQGAPLLVAAQMCGAVDPETRERWGVHVRDTSGMETPDPQQQIVTVFRNRLRPEAMDEYDEVAPRIEELARSMPGFLEVKTFVAEDGERCSIARFDSMEHQRDWRMNAEHQVAQRAGRDRFYSDYTIQVCALLDERTFQR